MRFSHTSELYHGLFIKPSLQIGILTRNPEQKNEQKQKIKQEIRRIRTYCRDAILLFLYKL